MSQTPKTLADMLDDVRHADEAVKVAEAQVSATKERAREVRDAYVTASLAPASERVSLGFTKD